MQRNYAYDIKKENITVLTSLKASEAMKYYNSTFNIIYKILGLTKNSRIYIDLVSEICKPTEVLLKFSLKINKQEYIININKDIIGIEHNGNYTEYETNYDGKKYYVTIVKYQEKQKDRIISQTFTNNRRIIIDMVIKDKYFKMEIPYTISYTLDTEFLRFLNINSNINDLKKVYFTRFYEGQDDYEKKLGANLYIYNLHLFEPILMDKLIIENGIVTYYLLSTIKDGIILSAEGQDVFNADFKIKNYNPLTEINLNEEANYLYSKVRKLVK